jgi:hypothetical protein
MKLIAMRSSHLQDLTPHASESYHADLNAIVLGVRRVFKGYYPMYVGAGNVREQLCELLRLRVGRFRIAQFLVLSAEDPKAEAKRLVRRLRPRLHRGT